MKKMLSLAAMFAVLSYASPASAELKIGGDAAIRARGQFNNSETAAGIKTTNDDDLKYQYKVRLKASADLGDGYFFKSLIQNEEVAGSWQTVGANNTEKYALEVSNFYFGHAEENSHFSIGRLPLNSFNNPIFDLALYPIPTSTGIYAVDIPITTYNFDRIFGLNYGGKVGDGELNGTLVILDNGSGQGNTSALIPGSMEGGLFNDGYALHVTYKNTIGNVTVEPQALVALTGVNGATYQRVAPKTFGLNATIPASKSKIGASAFYTTCKDDNTAGLAGGKNVDYSGYLLRLKGESGSAMAWVDYNHTKDNTAAAIYNNYDNVFVWAQYNFKVHESASGTFSLTPTVRYRASGAEPTATPGTTARNNQLRTELYATVTF